MRKVLIVYGTMEGQTARIAEFVATRLRERGHSVEVADSATLPRAFVIEHDAIIVGAPVRMLRYPRAVRRFVATQRAALNRLPSAFFSVCLAAASPHPEKQRVAHTWAEQFPRSQRWQPRRTAVFAGALRYRQYPVLLRFMMKRVAASEGVSTDTAHDHEYTDWNDVARFADDFGALL
jgi:menaquinone-dependent protoporphyrinogen oxidase